MPRAAFAIKIGVFTTSRSERSATCHALRRYTTPTPSGGIAASLTGPLTAAAPLQSLPTQLSSGSSSANALFSVVSAEQDPYHRYFEKYSAAQGHQIILPNSRPEKLRDQLSELEKALFLQRTINMTTDGRDRLQILLSSGSWVCLQFHSLTTDVTGIVFEKPSASSISPSSVTLSCHKEAGSIYVIDNRSIYLIEGKRCPIGDLMSKRMISRKIDMDSNVAQIDCSEDFQLIVFRSDTTIHIYGTGQEKELRIFPIAKLQGKGILRDIHVAKGQNCHIIHVIQQPYEDSSDLIHVLYECNGKKISKVKSTTIKLISKVLSIAISPQGSSIWMGCEDGGILCYDYSTDVVKRKQTGHGSILSLLWHPQGAFVVAKHKENVLRCYDAGSYSIDFVIEGMESIQSLNLSDVLGFQTGLKHMQWCIGSDVSRPNENTADVLALCLERGPIVALRFELGIFSEGYARPREIVNLRVDCGEWEKAAEIIQALSSPEEKCICFCMMFMRLLKMSDTDDVMDRMFHRFWSSFSSDKTKVYHPVRLLFLRYFYRYLRVGYFEKAFRIAECMKAKNLFEDIYAWAGHKGEYLIQAAASKRLKAFNVDLESLETPQEFPPGYLQARSIDTLLQVPSETWTPQEAMAVGLWHEHGGRYEEALKVYRTFKLHENCRQLEAIMAVLQSSMADEEHVVFKSVKTLAPTE